MATPAYIGQIGTSYNASTLSAFPTTATAVVEIGETIFVSVRSGGNIYVTSVSDSVGNVYSLIGRTTTGNTASLYGCVASNRIISSGTPTVVTCTMSAATSQVQVNLFAFRNVALIGSTATTIATTTTSITTGTITPNQVPGICISLATANWGTTSTLSTANGFTKITFTGTQWQGVAYLITPDTTARSTVWTEATQTHNWGSVICSLNATSGEFFQLF